VLTVSDRAAAGRLADESGPAVKRLLVERGFQVGEVSVLPDEGEQIATFLRERSQDHDLLVTTGGTGLGPRDRTPEATRAVIEYEVPGLAELMRSAGFAKTPLAALSRSLAGVRGRALILNLPGSLKGATESLESVLPVLGHAVQLLKGDTEHR
jgi:molybdopterin adenylyltransferase